MLQSETDALIDLIKRKFGFLESVKKIQTNFPRIKAALAFIIFGIAQHADIISGRSLFNLCFLFTGGNFQS